MAGRFIIGVVVCFLVSADARCSDEGSCESGNGLEDGISNSLLQQQAIGLKTTSKAKSKAHVKARSKAKSHVKRRALTLDDGTYVLDDGSCMLKGVPVKTVTFVDRQGEYYSKQCLEVCMEITHVAKEKMQTSEAEVEEITKKMEEAEAALVAGEQKLVVSQGLENEAKRKYDDSWKIRYSEREAPKKTWEDARLVREEGQKAVLEMAEAFATAEQEYKKKVDVRDKAIHDYNAKRKAAATCARVTFPIGSEGEELKKAKEKYDAEGYADEDYADEDYDDEDGDD